MSAKGPSLMMLLDAPSRPARTDRRKNKASRVFGPPYPFFDRRSLRTPVPGWRLRLHRSALWRRLVGEVGPGKRGVALAGGSLIGILLTPALLVIAVLIKCQDGGPILYWQTRVGRRGRCFAFPKFRSMVVNAEAQQEALMHRNHHKDCPVTFKDKTDPR